MKRIMMTICAVLVSLSVSFGQTDRDALIEALQNEVKELSRKNEELKKEVQRLKGQGSSSVGEEYRVQLGIQGSDKLVMALRNPKMIAGSQAPNGKMVYDIGGFSSPEDAYSLSREMRKLNLAGAFVTRYVNGVRDYDFKYDMDPKNPSPQYPSYRPNAMSSPKAYNTVNYTTRKSESLYIDDVRINTSPKSSTMVVED